MNARIVVVSCPRYQPIQEIWRRCQQINWPTCNIPITILSPTEDIGWNRNLIRYLDTITEDLILLCLEDHFIAADPSEDINRAIQFMTDHPEFGLMKLQAANASNPDLEFPEWPRFKEYDREPHPFKRTNLVTTLFRKDFLRRLANDVLEACGPARDKGRRGALEFEVTGTLLTENGNRYPERMLGINRDDESINLSVMPLLGGDGVREGYLRVSHQELEQCGIDLATIPGVQAFISA